MDGAWGMVHEMVFDGCGCMYVWSWILDGHGLSGVLLKSLRGAAACFEFE